MRVLERWISHRTLVEKRRRPARTCYTLIILETISDSSVITQAGKERTRRFKLSNPFT